MTTITFTHENFNKALNLVAYAMSKEEVRYYLNGIFICEEGFVATNGHRLSHYKPADWPLSDYWDDLPEHCGLRGVIIPAETVKKLLKIKPSRNDAKKNVTLTIDGATIAIEYETGQKLSTCAIDGTFPDYRRVIPDHSCLENPDVAFFNGDYLSDVVKALKAAGEKFPRMKIVCGNNGEPALVETKIDGLTTVIMPMPIRN
jgi:DNA polymerase-3 subunit beta